MGAAPGPDYGRTVRGAARAGADVGIGNLPAGGARVYQQHRCPNGAVLEVLTMLAWTIYLSFLGAAILLLLPRANSRTARSIALATGIAGLGCALLRSEERRVGKACGS